MLLLSVVLLLFTYSNPVIATHQGSSGKLDPAAGFNTLNYSDRNVVVLIHGWNPHGFNNSYTDT